MKRKRGKNKLLTGKINRKKGNMKKNEIHPYEQRAARQYNMLIISLDGSILMFLYFFGGIHWRAKIGALAPIEC